MSDAPPVRDGDRCEVIGGTHKGKAGRVEDSRLSKGGNWTVTVRMDDGERVKTLARNTRKAPA